MELIGLRKASMENAIKTYVELAYNFNPNIIHIHGSESFYGLIAPRLTKLSVLELQGILTEYVKVYFGQLPFHQRLSLPISLYDYLNMRRKAIIERQILRGCGFFLGHSAWDQEVQANLNPNGHYFRYGWMLRPEFSGFKWQLSQARRHSLYTTTSAPPYKGTHTLIDALAMLVRRFPDATLKIAGNLPNQGYGKLLHQRVKRLGLEAAVEFMGWLPAAGIGAELERAHAFVLPSFIENSPNSLAEAQMVGTPAVAAAAGGVPSMVQDGDTGLLFSPGDAGALAQKVLMVFENDALANRLSQGEQDLARERHNEKKVVASVLGAYQEICQSR
jgi:glycosyltransferase involved in cell wall biosynthesis